ncbi:MAG: exo-alpha-sialidase [Segetibacter sp.]
MKEKNCYPICRLLLVIFAFACAAKVQAQNASKVQISVINTVAPLMKGLPTNAAMQIRVYVPPGQEMTYSSIQMQLNEDALKSIEKIDVLMRNDREPAFISNAKVLASVAPSTKVIQIPIDLVLQPGLNYIWISPVVKKEADIDKKVFLQITGLTAANGSKHSVSKNTNTTGGPATFTRRLGVAVRKSWDDSVHTYRIPGITTTDKGTLIAVYDIRYKNDRDLPGNIDVGMSRSTDGGKTWEPMKVIMDMGTPHENNGIGDPSILFDPVTKKLWVAALWSKGNRSIAGSEPGLSPDTTGQFVLASSDDDGLTWSRPYSITTQVKNPAWHLYFNGPGNGIAMKNGTIVFPSQYWDESAKPGIPHSSIIYSDDHGKTWKSGTGAKSNTTESAVVETTPGTLMLNMRDNRGSSRRNGSYRSVATTTDMGKTWVEHPTSFQALPDPVCMASLIKATVNVKGQMKDMLFFSNVASQTARMNTTVKASLDMGETWLPVNELLVDARLTYGYSSLTKIDDNTIGILYEGERDMYFVRIPVGEIIK